MTHQPCHLRATRFPRTRPLLVSGMVAWAACASPTPAAQPSTGADATAADSVAAAMLQDVRELDPSIIVELRYATPHNFTGAPLPGYEGNRAYLRREAAAALAAVNLELSGIGVQLKVFDAYRPVRATQAMVSWAERTGRMDLFRDGYISSRSRHNAGVAVDLTLVDRASGEEFEMGTAYDTFTDDAHTANASGLAARNRRTLVEAMTRAGFVNYPREWWHFTYGTAEGPRFDMVIR